MPNAYNMAKSTNSKIIGKQRYKHLYHYTSFDSFIRIWLSGKLKFASVNNVNDLLEAYFSVSTRNWQQTDLLKKYNEIRNSYKQVSFTTDYSTHIKGCMSPMMWGIYADKRRGVCIEFDYDKILFPPKALKGVVRYKRSVNRSIELDPSLTLKDLKPFIIRHKNEIMFTKHISWAGENEYRILDDESDYLDIKDTITAVYLTSCYSQECLLVEKLVGDKVPVIYFGFKRAEDGNTAIPYIENVREHRADMEERKIPIVSLNESLKRQFHLK